MLTILLNRLTRRNRYIGRHRAAGIFRRPVEPGGALTESVC